MDQSEVDAWVRLLGSPLLHVLVEGQLPAGTDPALVEQQCKLRDVARAFSRGQEWERVEALAAQLRHTVEHTSRRA